MKKCMLFVALMLVFGWAALMGQENLAANPGFEEAPKAPSVLGGGWWVYQGLGTPEVKRDAAVARHGQASARTHAETSARSVLVSPHFKVSPADEIRFEVWVRGEHLQTNQAGTYAGIAFRKADGTLLERAYFGCTNISSEWSRLSGVAETPMLATQAEIHLGYTNAPGTLWFDDVAAVVTSPLSFSLVEGSKPWSGRQEITLEVVNRQTNEFRGRISAVVEQQTNTAAVVVPPKTARQVKVPVTLSGAGTHTYTINLFDEKGALQRLLLGRFRTSAPLVLFPACPRYHLAGKGKGTTRLDASVALDPAKRAGLKLVVDLFDAAGKRLQTVKGDAAKGDWAGVNLEVPTEAPGIFGITARLIDAAEKEVASATTDVRVCLPEQAQVRLGPDGFLRIDGQRQFPVGLYSSGRFEEMAAAGFTATHNYNIAAGEPDEPINSFDSALQQLLDRSWTNRMRMMVELPRKAIEQAQWQQVRRRIETFRHHPGLLCWGSEERVARGEAPLTNMATLYRLVRELDPDHPLVLGDTVKPISQMDVTRREFFPDDCMDVGIWWWYPIPLKDSSTNALEGGPTAGTLLQPPVWLTSSTSKKPHWIAIQAYQKPSKGARFPTPAEYRCQAYLSLINGVKGLFFYAGSGQRDYEGKPSGILSKMEEGHWSYVKELTWELRAVSPVIMAPPGAQPVAMSPAEAPVEFTTRNHEGKLYLIAANKSDQPQKVGFRSEGFKGRHAQILFEALRVQLEGETLKGDFRPFGVHVYRLE